MKTEKEIKEKIEEMREGMKDNVEMGSYFLASKYGTWAEALEWVLEDER